MTHKISPLLKTHALLFGALLVLCGVAYFVLSYGTGKLSAPYQKHLPAPADAAR